MDTVVTLQHAYIPCCGDISTHVHTMLWWHCHTCMYHVVVTLPHVYLPCRRYIATHVYTMLLWHCHTCIYPAVVTLSHMHVPCCGDIVTHVLPWCCDIATHVCTMLYSSSSPVSCSSPHPFPFLKSPLSVLRPLFFLSPFQLWQTKWHSPFPLWPIFTLVSFSPMGFLACFLILCVFRAK